MLKDKLRKHLLYSEHIENYDLQVIKKMTNNTKECLREMKRQAFHRN